MYRPSGEILLELKIKSQKNKQNRPTEFTFYNKLDQKEASTNLTYNKNNKIIEEKSVKANGLVVEKVLYTYYLNDTIKEIRKFVEAGDTLSLSKIEVFNQLGLLTEEVNFDPQLHKTSNKIYRTYDKNNYEIQNITFSYYSEKPYKSRREVSEYKECLKVKTTIYSIDHFSQKETLYTIVKYIYEYTKS